VLLGAGYDSRGYRLPALAESIVFEVDHPGTQNSKRERLARVAADPIARIEFVPVDFERDDLRRALGGAGHRSEAATTFVWEGVTNYLSADAVNATLAAVRELAHRNSILIFTYIDQAVLESNAAFPEAARWIKGVRRRGEPWTFGFHPAELREHLANRGFTLITDLSTADAGERYLPPHGRNEQGSRLYHVATATPAENVSSSPSSLPG
jgi:methyltransferase (TIGR00027 family)